MSHAVQHVLGFVELVGLLGSGFARRVKPLYLHRWGTDPFSRGSYSYALPGKADLQAAGLLGAEIPRDFEFAGTPRDPETGELLGEDPLEAGEFQSDFLEGAEDRT